MTELQNQQEVYRFYRQTWATLANLPFNMGFSSPKGIIYLNRIKLQLMLGGKS